MRRDCLIVLLILAAAGLGCGVFSSGDSGDTSVAAATPIGTPVGERAAKSIGPAGGEIKSSDGRITVTVPPGTVTAPTEFSIQPITNQAQTGLGNAYRLEPNGQFTNPVAVSFSLDADQLAGNAPEAFTVAFQDPAGVWQALADADFDQSKRTLTVQTTHFTDFSLWTFRLSPEKVTLRVGESIGLGLIGCFRQDSFTNRFRRLVGMEEQYCRTPAVAFSEWTATAGTLSADVKSAVYTAPARKPSQNPVIVHIKYRLTNSPNPSGSYDGREAEITIVDNAYRASGSAGGDTVFSGVICDIERGFTLKTTNPFLSEFKFAPGVNSSGLWRFAMRNGVTGGGKGSYTVEGTDMVKTAIHMSGFSTACIPVGCRSGGGDVKLTLTPLDTNECDGR